MKKLSEISNDTMLTVKCDDGDFEAMEKVFFLDGSYYLDRHSEMSEYPQVTIAEPIQAIFDWKSTIEELGTEMYEDWEDRFWGDISAEDRKVLDKAAEIVNKACAANLTYYEGEKVDIEN